MFVTVAALLGAVPSPWGVLSRSPRWAAWPSPPLAACSPAQDSDVSFPIVFRLVVVPMFLFSGTFFVSQLPDGLEPVARLTPLWHAVELCRGATTARWAWWRRGAPGGAGRVRGGRGVVRGADLPRGWPRDCAGPGGDPAGPRVVERNARVNVRMWPAFVSGFFEPAFYLFSIGVGVGALVGQVEGPGGRLVDYEQYVAPAMMAVAAMNGCIFDTTFNFFGKIKYAHTYDGMLATPLGVPDVVRGS